MPLLATEVDTKLIAQESPSDLICFHYKIMSIVALRKVVQQLSFIISFPLLRYHLSFLIPTYHAKCFVFYSEYIKELALHYTWKCQPKKSTRQRDNFILARNWKECRWNTNYWYKHGAKNIIYNKHTKWRRHIVNKRRRSFREIPQYDSQTSLKRSKKAGFSLLSSWIFFIVIIDVHCECVRF